MSTQIGHNGVKYALKYIVCFSYLIPYALCTAFNPHTTNIRAVHLEPKRWLSYLLEWVHMETS